MICNVAYGESLAERIHKKQLQEIEAERKAEIERINKEAEEKIKKANEKLLDSYKQDLVRAARMGRTEEIQELSEKIKKLEDGIDTNSKEESIDVNNTSSNAEDGDYYIQYFMDDDVEMYVNRKKVNLPSMTNTELKYNYKFESGDFVTMRVKNHGGQGICMFKIMMGNKIFTSSNSEIRTYVPNSHQNWYNVLVRNNRAYGMSKIGRPGDPIGLYGPFRRELAEKWDAKGIWGSNPEIVYIYFTIP